MGGIFCFLLFAFAFAAWYGMVISINISLARLGLAFHEKVAFCGWMDGWMGIQLWDIGNERRRKKTRQKISRSFFNVRCSRCLLSS